MKKIIIAFFIICSIKSNAQKLDFGFSSGTSLLYIIENYDSNINITYKSPLIISAQIKYTPINNFGMINCNKRKTVHVHIYTIAHYHAMLLSFCDY